ncbi:MAG: glutathione S-transferase family protein [Alphaproteobacteria bacterium]|nr:glutathione S-transferase family protein [Alphaproteobacteria bacterium]
MPSVSIYGSKSASYVRSVLLMCEEKGIDYIVERVNFGSDAHFEIHPFGKLPGFRHGNIKLYETVAIGVYIDETFEGPPLQPLDKMARVQMFQWLSVVGDYGAQYLIRELALPRIVAPLQGETPDEDAIRESLPKVERFFGVADAALRERAYLAGPEISLADLVLVPMIATVLQTPEGRDIVPRFAAVEHWFETMAARPSFAAAHPRRPARIEAA